MKSFTLLAAVSALSSQVFGHYIFQQFTYGGTTHPVGRYVRPNTNYNSPITDLSSNNLRCNEGGGTGANVETISVQAGQSFSITSDVAVYHNGPIAIYLAKAPSTAASFDGSGNVWFKIWQRGPTFNPVTWPLAQTYTATIPASLPNGQYLLRTEQIGIHNPYPAGLPQFYISCTQISVTGGGSGSPGPLVSIPGYVVGNEPGYVVNIYNNFNSYTFLGPAVWSGGGGGGGTPTTTTSRAPTTTTTTTRAATTTTSRTTTAAATTTSAAGGTGTVPKYGQCGGQGWTGGTVCINSVCTRANDFYSQCL